MLETIITTAIGSFIGFTICYFVWYRKLYQALQNQENVLDSLHEVFGKRWECDITLPDWVDHVDGTTLKTEHAIHELRKDVDYLLGVVKQKETPNANNN